MAGAWYLVGRTQIDHRRRRNSAMVKGWDVLVWLCLPHLFTMAEVDEMAVQLPDEEIRHDAPPYLAASDEEASKPTNRRRQAVLPDAYVPLGRRPQSLLGNSAPMMVSPESFPWLARGVLASS